MFRSKKDEDRRTICIYTRRGDFVPGGQASTADYTIKAIDKILENETVN